MGAFAGNGMGIKSLWEASVRLIVTSGVVDESTTVYGIPPPELLKSGCRGTVDPM